jgi:MFS family permease
MSEVAEQDPAQTPAAAGVVRTFREASPAVRILIAGMFVNRLGAFLHAFLVLYVVSRGYDAVRAGLAVTALGAGGIAGGLLGGWLTDRLGSRRTIVTSAAVTAVATAAVLYAPGFAGIMVCAALVGAFGQAYRPASSALIADLTPAPRYTMVFAMYRLATNLGATGGPVLGVALIAISYHALFWVEAAVLLAYAAVAVFLLPPDRVRKRPDKSDGTLGRGSSPLGDRRYLLCLVAVLLVSAVYLQHLVALPLMISAQGLSVTVFGLLIALNGLIVACLELPLTRYTQHWSPRVAFLLNTLLIGVGMSLYALPVGIAGLVLATVVWSLGEIVGAPAMFAYPARIAPPESRGRYLGAFNASISLAFAAGPVVGAQLWTSLGTRFWLACGAVCAVAALAAYTATKADPPQDVAD